MTIRLAIFQSDNYAEWTILFDQSDRWSFSVS